MRNIVASICALVFLPTIVACTAVGPTHVEPQMPLEGIAQVLEATPAGGSLNILFVHGMGAKEEQSHQDIVSELTRRLELAGGEYDSQVRLLAADSQPSVVLNGSTLWSGLDDWKDDAPRLRIRRFTHVPTGKQVNIYLFEYFQALTRIKCAALIAADRRLIGESDAYRDCSFPADTPIPERLGARPASLNGYLKSNVIEWGIADAVIATSGFRVILRQAIREAMTAHRRDVMEQRALRSESKMADEPEGDAGVQALMAEDAPDRFVIITRSLGSYVFFDALADEMRSAAEHLTADGPRSLREQDSLQVAGSVCSVRQIHMLANQLPLLRLSEISVGDAPAVSPDVRVLSSCDALREQLGAGKHTIQVVAYHEPNDPLTFFVEDPQQTGFTFANVVASFAKVWVPFLLADPLTAHTGQARNDAVMEILVKGYSKGYSSRERGIE